MINFTERLDKAIRISAWAHERQNQHRKGTDIPYIIHPFGVMLIASNVTGNEDILIACLLHDVLEDVNPNIYDEKKMRSDFGANVLAIVEDVTKNSDLKDWRERSKSYLKHLEHKASDAAVIVSTADKIHNLMAILTDYKTQGGELWQRFSTKSGTDQLWWYESILRVATRRNTPQLLTQQLSELVASLKQTVADEM